MRFWYEYLLLFQIRLWFKYLQKNLRNFSLRSLSVVCYRLNVYRIKNAPLPPSPCLEKFRITDLLHKIYDIQNKTVKLAAI